MNPPAVLFLPGWYPTPADPQDGVFIRKHALAVSQLRPVIVLFPVPEGAYNLPQSRTIGALHEYFPTYKPSGLPLIGPALTLLRFFLAALRGLRIIRKTHQPRIVHLHVILRNGMIAMWLHFFHRLPFLLTEHWTGYLSGAHESLSSLRRFVMRIIARQSRLITVVSPALRDAMIQADLHHDIRIVPNVVESVGRSRASIVASTRSEGPVRILNVSDFYDEKKNVSGLLRAFSSLVCKGIDAELHIIGDGPDRKLLHTLADTLPGLSGRVKFSGRVANEVVLEAMAKTHFYVCPSHFETFSVSTAEALAAGKPVICTACGGPEYFVDSSCGFVIPKANQKALEEALSRMCQQFQNFNPAALRSAANRFQARTVGLLFEEIYLEIQNDDSEKISA